MSPPLDYQRARFHCTLPTDRWYTAGHYWAQAVEPAVGDQKVWRVGLTPFALRILGEIVEFEFESVPGSAVAVGDTIGWMEAFKATTELFSVARGTFVEANPALSEDIDLLQRDGYGKGWLYMVKGDLDPNIVDAYGYTALLDRFIACSQGESRAT